MPVIDKNQEFVQLIHERSEEAKGVLYDKVFRSEIDKILLIQYMNVIDDKLYRIVASQIQTIFIDLLEGFRQILCPYTHDGLQVVCDATNNPQSVRENNALRVCVSIPFRGQAHRSLIYYREISTKGLTDYAHSS